MIKKKKIHDNFLKQIFNVASTIKKSVNNIIKDKIKIMKCVHTRENYIYIYI